MNYKPKTLYAFQEHWHIQPKIDLGQTNNMLKDNLTTPITLQGQSYGKQYVLKQMTKQK